MTKIKAKLSKWQQQQIPRAFLRVRLARNEEATKDLTFSLIIKYLPYDFRIVKLEYKRGLDTWTVPSRVGPKLFLTAAFQNSTEPHG